MRSLKGSLPPARSWFSIHATGRNWKKRGRAWRKAVTKSTPRASTSPTRRRSSKPSTRSNATIGPIDILFNNAGIQRRGPLIDFKAETWRELMATDLDSVFFVGQAVARRMLPRRRGKIVNTCSLTSEVGRANIAPYTAAKGAVKMLTKAMCVEWAPRGLQVNGIGPGYFKTELNSALVADAAFDEWVRKRTPAGRWGEVDELKGVAVFLASDASNFVNGQVIYVDGGLLSGM